MYLQDFTPPPAPTAASPSRLKARRRCLSLSRRSWQDGSLTSTQASCRGPGAEEHGPPSGPGSSGPARLPQVDAAGPAGLAPHQGSPAPCREQELESNAAGGPLPGHRRDALRQQSPRSAHAGRPARSRPAPSDSLLAGQSSDARLPRLCGRAQPPRR